MPAKAHKPTDQNRRTVESMAAYGITHDEIAAVIGVSDETLRKYYREELHLAATKANAKVAERIWHIAMGKVEGQSVRDSVTMLCFWAKCRMGWRETNNLELTGRGGGPLEIAITRRIVRAGDED